MVVPTPVVVGADPVLMLGFDQIDDVLRQLPLVFVLSHLSTSSADLPNRVPQGNPPDFQPTPRRPSTKTSATA